MKKKLWDYFKKYAKQALLAAIKALKQLIDLLEGIVKAWRK